MPAKGKRKGDGDEFEPEEQTSAVIDPAFEMMELPDCG